MELCEARPCVLVDATELVDEGGEDARAGHVDAAWEGGVVGGLVFVGDVAEAERFDELLEAVDVAEVGVVGDVDGLVGVAHAEVVHRDGSVACVDQDGDHLAVEERPGWLAVQEQHHGGVCRAFVDVALAEAVDVD